MIDSFFVFNKRGLILWSYKSDIQPEGVFEEVLNGLIENIFLEERLTQEHYDHGQYRVNWDTINDKELIMAVIYQRAFSSISSTSYAETLLSLVRKKIIKLVPKNLNIIDETFYFDNFDSQFFEIIEYCDDRFMTKNNDKNNKNLKEKNKEKSFCEDSSSLNNKSKKSSHQWSTQKVTKKAMEQLDYSKKSQSSSQNYEERYFQEKYNSLEDIEDESEEFEEKNSTISYWTNLISNQFGILNSNTVITEEMIDKPLQKLKTKLVEKNVASEIAQDIIQSVSKALIGIKTQDYISKLDNILFNNLRESITRILSPKRSIDVLSEALNAKQHGIIYSIVFLGVNGVGKSTNLAKLCYYLKNKGNLNVMIVACDTFRAGAIEQLKTHANCLGVYLYERGYGKDAALIAKDAISYAKENKYDVVLIDTAGRMQDNIPLMKSLAKLVQVNKPNLILFVGEALVGNDAVHQLQVFNKYLIEFSDRPIDGIILTKFDTVDEKVGAALSMVYSTGQPIVFVGTGQKYYNLKTLSVPAVVNALLK